MTPLGLYVHVPFCRCKCDWCAFASEEGTRGVASWLRRVLRDLEQPPVDSQWETIYIGGGTPSLLKPRELETLLSATRLRAGPGAELTVEANPESLSAEHVAVLREQGVTRLSLGIQSFQEDLLERHGRPTRRHHWEAARRWLHGAPFAVSLDLIAGLAGQTAEGQRRDLDEALDWNPQHLSFYALGVEPGTPLDRAVAAGRMRLPGEEAETWWLEGRDRIETAGLAAYEVSNFARPGSESRHNQRYWNLQPWWGLGPSAVSFLPDESGQGTYRTEPATLATWLAHEPVEVERPSRLEAAKDVLVAGLRQTSGIPVGLWPSVLPLTLERWDGRIQVSEGRLFLTRQAFPFLDAFLRDAFVELDDRPEFR